jgi:hypothetical protein
MEAQIRGIETTGYEPTAIDIAALKLAKMPAMPTAEPEKSKEMREQLEQRAEKTLNDLELQLQKAWRKDENKRLLDEAEEKRQAAWALKAKEPNSFFSSKKHDAWVVEIQHKIDDHSRLRQEATKAIEGKSPNELSFSGKARVVLKEKYPELAQALIDKAARERLEREEKQREQAKIREQQRQAQAQKSKQNSRDRDMER